MSKKKGAARPPHLELPEAPVFHPTDEEFSDPLKYLADVVRHVQAVAALSRQFGSRSTPPAPSPRPCGRRASGRC